MADKKCGFMARNIGRVRRPEEQTEEQRRRAPKILLGVLAGLVLIALIVWGLRVWGDSGEPESAPAPTSPSTTEPSAPTEAACELDTQQVDISEEPPVADQWVAMRFVTVPDVEGAGPCEELDGFDAGYAPTMTGAVVAAYYYAASLYVDAPDASTYELADYALVDGSLKDALLERIEQVNNGVQPRANEEGLSAGDIVGYRVSLFEGETAVVEILGQSDAGSYTAGTARLQWVDGDWRIDPISEGNWSSQQEVRSVNDYVLWDRTTQVEG